MKALNSLEVFAGIGGLTLGLEMAECATPAAFCEINPFARAVLGKHWHGVPQYDDVKTLTANTLAGDGITEIDLIAGGFPCQPHSQAGLRESSNDERDLWHEFARIIGEVKLRWVVAENVPGLLSSADPVHNRGKGGFFLRVLRDLAQMGFDAEWCTFPASAVGAHHTRQRIWIVAHAQQFQSRQRYDVDVFRGRQEETQQARLGSSGTDTLADTKSWGCSTGGLSFGTAQEQPFTRQCCEVVADPHRTGLPGRISQCSRKTQHTNSAHCGANVDNAQCLRRATGRADHEQHDWNVTGSTSQNAALMADTMRSGRGEQYTPAQPGWAGYRAGRSDTPDWAGGEWEQPSPVTVSAVRGMAHGLPGRVDRLTALGNAVVPQAAQVIGYAITDAEAYWHEFGVMPAQIVRPEHIERVRCVA